MQTHIKINKYLVIINSAGSIIAKLINMAVLFWAYQYLLKRIPPEEFSIFPIVISIMVFLPLLTIVFSSGISRFIIDAYASGDEERVTQISSTMFVILLAAGMFLMVAGGFFVVFIDRILTIDSRFVLEARIMMGLLIATFALSLPLHPFALGFYILQKFIFEKTIRLCMEIFRIIVLFILLFYVSTSVMWLVVAISSSTFLSALIRVSISLRLVPSLRFRFKHIKFKLAKELITFGTWLLISNLANRIRMSSDPLILNKLASPLDVTSFHIGSMFLKHIQSMSMLLLYPLGPQLIAINAMKDNERFKRIYTRGGKYSLWMGMIITVPLIVYRKELMLLYVGEKYSDSSLVLMLLLLTVPFTFGHVMLNKIAFAIGKIRDLSITMLVMQIVNLILTIYLVGVQKMGAVGSALSTAIVMSAGYTGLYVPMGFRLLKLTFPTWIKETCIPGLLPGCVSCLIWLILRNLVQPTTWLSLILCCISGGIVYVTVLVMFCFGQYEKDELRHGFGEIKSNLSWNEHFDF